MPKKLVGIPERCIGCHSCEQACAFANFGVANISKARIKVHSTINGELRHHIDVCSHPKEEVELIENVPKNAVSINREENKIDIDEEKYPQAAAFLKECPPDALFFHDEVPYPLVCKLKLACVRWCPTGALKVEEVEQ
ncbi:MAG: 4Fe-4S dicluster domain-containing protein [Candidatus Korarchaeota archaeon]|nr:4Fe-4S dicluster domain-containing protein [Candidatus Korarchaeota archaeon]NIU85544.1 4Fe-4S dicluster domain-containing protein [Candidatus Thorarchaeota archaeon]NIW15655.1 4Fe-4S dicluster domain-containing protein [Candidatus Thorarchaeota archaeon]NIW53585.1 4Fe-4S dicluster domain-containing protein [Candidatus Korarchaeota archaeon]